MIFQFHAAMSFYFYSRDVLLSSAGFKGNLHLSFLLFVNFLTCMQESLFVVRDASKVDILSIRTKTAGVLVKQEYVSPL